MEKTEFIERAAKTFRAGCPRFTDIVAADAAEELWDDGRVAANLITKTPEELVGEELSYWSNNPEDAQL